MAPSPQVGGKPSWWASEAILNLLPMQASPVLLDWEDDESGTIVRMRSSTRSVRLKEITPILDSLGLEIVSFGVEKSPASHDARFTIVDGEGAKLQPSAVAQLISTLERDLPMQVLLRQGTLAVAADPLHGNINELQGMRSTSSHLPDTPPFSRHSKTVSWAALDVNSPSADSQHSSMTDASALAAPPLDGRVEGMLRLSTSQLLQHNQHHEHQEELLPQSGRDNASGVDGVSRLADEDCDEPLWEGGLITPEDPVERIMSRPVRWIAKEADLSQAKALMNLWGISALMVDTGGEQPGRLRGGKPCAWPLKSAHQPHAMYLCLVLHLLPQVS